MLFSLFVILQNLFSPNLALAANPDSIERGKYLFTLSSCTICHTQSPNKFLAGGVALKTDFGVFYTPNISSDKKTGIGNWTGPQFLKAMREGISPSGYYYYPSFPFTNYSKMTDADILSIRDYIMSQPGIEQANQPPVLKAPYNHRNLLFFWRALYFPSTSGFGSTGYLKTKGPWKNIDSKTAEWNRGAYLVEGPLHCTQCHTPRDQLGGLILNKWMSGSILNREGVPNITPDYRTGLSQWDTKDWQVFMKQGVDPDGTPTSGDMHKLVRLVTSQLSDDDLLNVINYLQSLPPVESTLGN